MYVPQLSYPFICQWTSRLLPCPSYTKQCFNKHWGTRVSFNYGFLGVHAQQWDCWVIWQFSVMSDSLPPHGLVHGILQARILDWVAFPFSRGSSQPRDWTQVFRIAGRFFTNWAIREGSIPKKGNAKECSNYHTIAFISHTSKVMLKILQARLQQYMNCELPYVQAGLEKAEEPEIKLPTSAGSSKKQESSRKTFISSLLTMPKPLTVWMTTNCGKYWKRWEYQTTWPASWEICMQVKKQQLEPDMEQQTGSK